MVQTGYGLPMSWPVDPNSTFQPGRIAQLGAIGNNIVAGVSDGTAPIGVIDDIKTKAFTTPSINEVVIAPAVGERRDGQIVSIHDVKALLKNSNVTPSSFISDPVDVELIPKNGVIIFPAGTPLNFSIEGTGNFDAIRTVVNYTYQVPNIPGDDTTQASGHVTVWFQRMIFQTDQYETNQRYALGDNVFVQEEGLLTSRQVSAIHPGVGLVTGPPTSPFTMLEVLWL